MKLLRLPGLAPLASIGIDLPKGAPRGFHHGPKILVLTGRRSVMLTFSQLTRKELGRGAPPCALGFLAPSSGCSALVGRAVSAGFPKGTR